MSKYERERNDRAQRLRYAESETVLALRSHVDRRQIDFELDSLAH